MPILGTLSIDDEWDDGVLPEVAEVSWTLLRMLGSSSTCCLERENPWFGVQQWTWVNLLVFLPLKSTFLKEISYQLRIRVSTYIFFVFLYLKHQKIDWYRSSQTSTSESHQNFLVCVFQLFAKQKGLQVKKVQNQLVLPFFSLRTVVICRQTLETVGFIFLCKGGGIVRQTWFGVMPRSVYDMEPWLSTSV